MHQNAREHEAGDGKAGQQLGDLGTLRLGSGDPVAVRVDDDFAVFLGEGTNIGVFEDVEHQFGGAAEARAARRGLELSREAAAYLVHRLPRDMHSLCAVLDRLDEAALVAQRRLTVPFLREVLEAQVPDST